uniref:Uncharacterized protein n=1 Tax=Arundo donax TaxID=35708 RepID=A0A0A9BHJ8_ARUDO
MDDWHTGKQNFLLKNSNNSYHFLYQSK